MLSLSRSLSAAVNSSQSYCGGCLSSPYPDPNLQPGICHAGLGPATGSPPLHSFHGKRETLQRIPALSFLRAGPRPPERPLPTGLQVRPPREPLHPVSPLTAGFCNTNSFPSSPPPYPQKLQPRPLPNRPKNSVSPACPARPVTLTLL